MSSEQACIRESIQLLAQILTSCGCPKLPSEVFRRAKFNQPSVTTELWQLLSHAVRVSNALDEGRAPEIPFAIISDKNLPQAALQVKGYLLVCLGYARSAFFSVDHSQISSRELLLAFGWLLRQSNFFLRLKTYHATAVNTLTLPASRKSREHVEQDCERFRKQVETLLSALRSCTDTKGAKNALQTLVWVRGKLLAQLKAAALGQLAYQKLASEIHKSTIRSGRDPSHLSIHEVFLLKHPKCMAMHISETEKHLYVLERLLAWELEHETIFWQWMQSVLDQDSKEGYVNDDTEIQEHLHTVEGLKAQVYQLECELDVLLKERGIIKNVCHKKKICSELTVDGRINGLTQCFKHLSLEGDSMSKLSLDVETLSPMDLARLVPRQLPVTKTKSYAPPVGEKNCDFSTCVADGGPGSNLALSEEFLYKLKVDMCEQLR